MPDQVKQLAFKEFSVTEIQNGTAANVLTTDATTHHVIKSIETTQGNNSDAVEASATIGLTSGLASGQFTSLGTVAKKDRVGSSGSAIMDASSTLTIRPSAKSMSFADRKLVYAIENATIPRIYNISNTPTINGNVETTLETKTTLTKTGNSFSGHSYGMSYNYSNNHSFIYTRADGVNIIVIIFNNTSSTTGFEVYNGDTGAYYGYYTQNYSMPWWDGGRYIYSWNDSPTSRINYFDLEESLTNFTPSNTYGGGNSSNYYHGYILVGSGSDALPSYQKSSWDNRRCSFYVDKNTGQKFIIQAFAGHTKIVMAELPSGTHTNNNASANVTTKWVFLGSAGNASSIKDPFEQNSGQNWSMGYAMYNYASSVNVNMRLTFDDTLGRYLIFLHYDGSNAMVFTFTKTEYDSTANGQNINQGGGSEGLAIVSTHSGADVGIDSNYFDNLSNQNARLRVSQLLSAASPSISHSANYERFYDGANIIITQSGSPADNVYKVSLSTQTPSVENLTSHLTSSQVNQNRYNTFWYGYSIPSSTSIASRSYTLAPGLKVRITGIDVDQ